jgi:hypothetical protein
MTDETSTDIVSLRIKLRLKGMPASFTLCHPDRSEAKWRDLLSVTWQSTDSDTADLN